MEKISVMKHIPYDWLQQELDMTSSLDGIPHSGLLSSIAKFKDDLVFCDAGTVFTHLFSLLSGLCDLLFNLCFFKVGQMVFKLNGSFGSISSFQFSNFGILGLPYWFQFPLEQVYAA